MNRRVRRKRVVAEINITPFTDVILVLLVIFMVATPLLSQSSLKVNLPHSSAAQSVPAKTPVSVTITSAGPVYLGKDLVTSSELKEKMDMLVSTGQDVAVVLNIDRAVAFKYVVKVLDVVNGAGIKDINIAAVRDI